MVTDILIRPLITEKMTLATEKEKSKRYGFVVDRKANKLQIKDAVEKTYGVKVEAVNTMVYSGKSRYRYTRSGIMAGKTNSFKKAIITLVEGESIDFYSSI